MKKSTVMKLYNELDNKELIKKSLPRMIDVKGDSEDIFYNLCIKYKDILNSDILDSFINISIYASLQQDTIESNLLLESIKNIFDNDYLISNENFNAVLENINYIMNVDFSCIFDIYDVEEEKYYTSEIISELSKALSLCKNYDINKIYDHDLKFILSKFFDVLDDLESTNVDNQENLNKYLMDRIKIFLDIVFTREIYELDEYKYNAVIDIASTINDVDELKKFKKKIIFFSRLNKEDFVINLDDSVDILTNTSVMLSKKGKNKNLKFDNKCSK